MLDVGERKCDRLKLISLRSMQNLENMKHEQVAYGHLTSLRQSFF